MCAFPENVRNFSRRSLVIFSQYNSSVGYFISTLRSTNFCATLCVNICLASIGASVRPCNSATAARFSLRPAGVSRKWSSLVVASVPALAISHPLNRIRGCGLKYVGGCPVPGGCPVVDKPEFGAVQLADGSSGAVFCKNKVGRVHV